MTNTDRTRKYEQRRRNSLMNISFENKVALVTGAGSGMGLATAKAFAEAGASVGLGDIHEEAGGAPASHTEAPRREAPAICCAVCADGAVASISRRPLSPIRRLG